MQKEEYVEKQLALKMLGLSTTAIGTKVSLSSTRLFKRTTTIKIYCSSPRCQLRLRTLPFVDN